MSRIQVVMVEDERDYREPVLRFLTMRGMDARGVGSVAELEALLADLEPDVILLDAGLPGEDGLSAVGRLRERTRAGLVMLTARADTDSRIKGRQDGADDYLAKPVDLRELEAVIMGLKRRLGDEEERGEPTTPASWRVDPSAWRLTAPSGQMVSLSSAEWSVINLLTTSPGEPVHRDDLLACMGLAPRDTEDRRLDVMMSRLRRKLAAEVPEGENPIHTVRNVGYAFAAPVLRAEE